MYFIGQLPIPSIIILKTVAWQSPTQRLIFLGKLFVQGLSGWRGINTQGKGGCRTGLMIIGRGNLNGVLTGFDWGAGKGLFTAVKLQPFRQSRTIGHAGRIE